MSENQQKWWITPSDKEGDIVYYNFVSVSKCLQIGASKLKRTYTTFTGAIIGELENGIKLPIIQ
jgi:hypothetical protein